MKKKPFILPRARRECPVEVTVTESQLKRQSGTWSGSQTGTGSGLNSLETGRGTDSQEGERALVAGAQSRRRGQEPLPMGPHTGSGLYPKSNGKPHPLLPSFQSPSGVVEARTSLPVQFPVSLEAQPCVGVQSPRARPFWGSLRKKAVG